jgi:predicted HicB family RNase H-like nuclease
MSEASFASLGPTLLARKGGAKPAMRPQLAPLPELMTPEADQLEDLGWNDMGGDGEDDFGASAGLAPNVAMHPTARAEARVDDRQGSEGPLVHRQQQLLAERVLADAPAKPRKPAKRSGTAARRAAFTLRLDTQRHLKLRLAATMQGVSAQALVTEALDAMLSEIDDLDTIVARFNDRKQRN